MPEVIREPRGQREEGDPQGHLSAPQQPQRESRAKEDGRHDEDAMKRNHRGVRSREPGFRVKRPCPTPSRSTRPVNTELRRRTAATRALESPRGAIQFLLPNTQSPAPRPQRNTTRP